MAFLTTSNVNISGIVSCVPKNTYSILEYPNFFSEKEKKKFVKSTGIKERRIADNSITASDLCFIAADKLLNEMNIDRHSINAVIFLSQTPDYDIPMTSTILQYRLNLPKTTAAFDLNVGCSGFVYGLSVAFAYASQCGMDRVLFLIGETLSKILSAQDKSTTLLFGDGASAILVEKNTDFPQAYFSLNSDGSGEDAIKIPYGGYRNKVTWEVLQDTVFDDGSLRNGLNLTMNGADVFDFTVREIVDDILSLLMYSKTDISEIDYFIFHQSNQFIIDFFVRKLGVAVDKVPTNIDRFGNTSGVSIPLVLTTEAEKMNLALKPHKILCSGYGAGLSWGSSVITLDNCFIGDLIEV